ncbi:MAG: beta galactosidase jelly roll domain-containing protein, partial [Solirubrobacteraceae bacterium]|nr:beta galactosidase jelly roll domain-containing protein [Solirubrobacteraceae bacterium]
RGPAYAATTPSARVLYEQGPSGRYLLDGTWLFRADPTLAGERLRWQSSSSTVGWVRTSVPNAWNATDESLASYLGAVGWYRRDFRLPSRDPGLSWVVRFESVNYRARVWLNGRLLGRHAVAQIPFELRLPRGLLRRNAVNRLVVRVDSRRGPSDLPPQKLDVRGRPQGGWWNYGGILREVYLRRVADVDLADVGVSVRLPCARCAATVRWEVLARNLGTRTRSATLTARLGARRVALGRISLAPGSQRKVTRAVRLTAPRLWWPDRPALYDASVTAGDGARVLQRVVRRIGIRSVRVDAGGLLRLNGRRLDVRGFGLHEDSREHGFAIDNRARDAQLGWARELGATMLRAHYPLHPHTLERADALGLLVWSEVPVYQLESSDFAKPSVRRAAVALVAANVRESRSHPSIALWSLGNELSARTGPALSRYLTDAAAAARAVDPTRPVALAISGAPTVGCQSGYEPLDVVGINDYFGWYPGATGLIADRDLLGDYLDSMRRCLPRKALIVSEFGAEANRSGPVEERGTYEFQSDWIDYQLGVFARRPWLSGAIYWALQEFRVRPGWDGGNPRPDPPIHEKGLVTFDGRRKPAFSLVRERFRATRQVDR